MDVPFHRPQTLAAAIEHLVEDDDARLLAGGQTLVAAFGMGLYTPSAIVTLAAIDGLRGISRLADGTIRIGAMTTHAEIAASTAFEAGQRVIPSAASQIANPAVRNFGTIGGSCASADPAADWPTALVAADAKINVTGRHGARAIAAGTFFKNFMTTALEPAEIITSIDVPPLPGRGLHRKLVRVAGDYAVVSVSAIVAGDGAVCAFARLAAGSYGPRPVHAPEADMHLAGGELTSERAREAGTILARAGEPSDDSRATADYRRRVLPVIVARTIGESLAS